MGDSYIYFIRLLYISDHPELIKHIFKKYT